MRSCSYCRSECPDYAQFCGYCGQHLKPLSQFQIVLNMPSMVHSPTPLVQDDDTAERPLPAITRPLHVVEPPLLSSTHAPESAEPPLLSVAPLTEDEPLERKQGWLIEYRLLIAEHLLDLIPLVDEEHQKTNKALFEQQLLTRSPIDEEAWGQIAFITGVYGRYMWKRPLQREQKQKMWQTLVWAIWYEHFFRPKMVKNRLRDILIFFNACNNDPAFVASAIEDITGFLPILDVNPLRKLHDALANISSSTTSDILQLCDEIEQWIALSPALTSATQLPSLASASGGTETETAQIFTLVEHYWHLLDKKSEGQNRTLLKQASEKHAADRTDLAMLAFFISRNIVYRYCHDNTTPGKHGPRNNLPAQDLLNALLLSDFATRYSSQEAARRYHVLLSGLERLRTHTLDPDGFLHELREASEEHEQEKGLTPIWSDLIGMVTHHLTEMRSSGKSDPVEAERWVQALARIDDFSACAREQFVTEAKRHGVLDSAALNKLSVGMHQDQQSNYSALEFLDNQQREAFLESMRHSRLDQMGDLLQQTRQGLFTILKQRLFDPGFDELLAPRYGLRITNKGESDLFPQAKLWILGTRSEEWQKALHIFEHVEQEKTRREDIALAREWSLFAQARVYGPMKPFPCWEEDRSKGTASWEEIWNLAIFYMRIKHPAQALEVLMPGIRELQAPVMHLYFALYCGIHIIERTRDFEACKVEQATAFLLDYLAILPLPECALAWLLLMKDAHTATSPLPILSTFQELLDKPVTLPRPDENLSDSTLETFEKTLQRLKLASFWRIWIHDYAQRHPFSQKAWQELSETYEQVGRLKQAEQALQHIVRMHQKQYQEQQQKLAQKDMPLKDLQGFKKRLRASLLRLFEFYRRTALQHQEREAFNLYQQTLPEFWDSRDAANSQLLHYARAYLDGNVLAKASRNPDNSFIEWEFLSELAAVQTLSDLKPLQARLDRAMGTFAATHTQQKVVREQVTVISILLAELCTLDTAQESHEVKRLNSEIQRLDTLTEQEQALKPFRALISAYKRAFTHFSTTQKLVPIPRIHPVPLGPGLPDDLTETSLVLHIFNPGPGNITNVQISCTDKGLIASRKDVRVDVLRELEEDIVALPVSMPPIRKGEHVDCQIHFTYQWGTVQGLTCSSPLVIRWFSFHDFLQRHQLHDYELPIPYVFNSPINVARHDARLFQGRESEINLIRSIFLHGQMLGADPLYFYGIRKVGKTSLLHRIAFELKKGDIVPVVVDLHGIKASQQRLEGVINALSRRILVSAGEQGIDVEGISEVAVNHEDPLFGLERFFKALRDRTGRQQIVLLLDGFHALVAEHTTRLLDLLHQIHQSDLLLFLMSSWQRPEQLHRLCPETRLFPLMGRPLDFLPLEAVRQILHAPIANFGIDIPESTVHRVYKQTAGNPYHVAKIAWQGIARLNAEHRTVLAPQDIDEIAALLADDPANFTASSFSPLIFTPEEQKAAIHFAKELSAQRDFLPLNEASTMLGGLELIHHLEEKNVFKLQADRLHIRGKMLATYLRNRMPDPVIPHRQETCYTRVGLFVDYENLLPLIPNGMKPKEVGDALTRYAEHYGEIVCRWACADPRNIPGAATMSQGLKQAGFNVKYPSGESYTGQASKNLTDFALLECITDENRQSKPNIYILVSGDKDYYEKIIGLLESGNIVHLVASTNNAHLARKYRALQEKRLRTRHAEGYTEPDFFIDDLDAILATTTSSVV